MDWTGKLSGTWENPANVDIKLSDRGTITLNADGTAQVRHITYDQQLGQEVVTQDETMTYVLEDCQITVTAAGLTASYAVFRLDRVDTGELMLKVIGGQIDKGYLITYTYAGS